jgi:hypothetical protein
MTWIRFCLSALLCFAGVALMGLHFESASSAVWLGYLCVYAAGYVGATNLDGR